MEENKQTFLKIEKIVYLMLVMISIVLITSLSYLETTKLLYICPIVLILELIIYVVIKNMEKKQKILSDTKIGNIKKFVYIVAAIFTIAFVALVIFVVYKIIDMGALTSLAELLSVNILSFIIFAILICTIFVLANKNNNSTEKVENVQSEKPTKKLTTIVYSLFVIMTCVIPFIYTYFVNSSDVTRIIWVAGSLSTLIFGVLTSAILRCASYHNMSYSILGLSIWFVALMGLFSNISSFVLGYILFLVSIIISLVVIYLINRYVNKK